MLRVFLSGSFVFWIGLAQPAIAQGTVRVSVDSAGNQMQSRKWTRHPSMTPNGRFVLFESEASVLVSGDSNNQNDIFLHDRQTGQTTRVNINEHGDQANDISFDGSISADGRMVAFTSEANNFMYGDSAHNPEIFVRDRQTGVVIRANVDSFGKQANHRSFDSVISLNGRFVVFESWASNLVVGDTNGEPDIFLHDLETRETTRVSVGSMGVEGNGRSGGASISATGDFIAFFSHSDNLVPGDTNNQPDFFVLHRPSGEVKRVSVDSFGNQGNNWSFGRISADGHVVVFESPSDNLVPGDVNSVPDIFVHDLISGQTRLVSVDSFGNQANNASTSPAISGDGRLVTFASFASNLVPVDTNVSADIFLHDCISGETQLVSVNSAGNQSKWVSGTPSISADGEFVAFASIGKLVPGDRYLTEDIFVHGGPILSSTGTCPGTMEFTADGVPPGHWVAFVLGSSNGGFRIPPGQFCSPLQLDLVPIMRPLPGYVVALADSQGQATVTGFIPPEACGRLIIQAFDTQTCTKSNSVPL